MARRAKKPPPELYELEAEIMEQIWREQEANGARHEVSVKDVLELLNRGPKKRAYTTVMTVMVRLADKGFLKRRRKGRFDVYRVLVDRERYRNERARAEVDAVLRRYGDVAVAHFADQVGTLDARRLEELRALAGDD